MIVPRHWAEARLRHRDAHRQVTVRRLGWSNESVEAAEAHARERAQTALTAILAGQDLPRREAAVAYNGAEGVPIREEIVAEHGEVVLSRNSYGAVCLNVPDVLFADIDYAPVDPPWGLAATAWIVFAAVMLQVEPEARASSAPVLFLLGAAAVAATLWLAYRLARARPRGLERRARERVRRYAESEGWRVRVYRTPAGLRLLAMHRRFDPTSTEVAAAFAAMDVDPVYARMCTRQRCFRARLTPKPWRAGIRAHIRPRSGRWPVPETHRAARQRWIAAYEEASRKFASCRYLETLGAGAADPMCEDVRVLHDALCGAEKDLPLA